MLSKLVFSPQVERHPTTTNQRGAGVCTVIARSRQQQQECNEGGDLPIDELHRIDEACAEFERLLVAGKQPQIENYLDKFAGQSRLYLLEELLHAEREFLAGTSTGQDLKNLHLKRFADARGIVERVWADSIESDVVPVESTRTKLHRPGNGIGQTLGRYRLLRLIGKGGMGEVYHAQDSQLGRDVAIKILRSDVDYGSDGSQRFEHEAKAIAGLNHPHIVTLFDYGDHEGRPYAVTELLQGESLASRLTQESLPWRQAAEWARQIASALDAAHGAKIVHRDLKPENLYLLPDGRIKVLDFGLSATLQTESKLLEPEQSSPTNDSQCKELTNAFRHTIPGTVLGTLGYMAPEQLRGERSYEAADFFSLGCVLYEMLTGKEPFKQKSQAESIAAVLYQTPDYARLQEADVPAALIDLIQHCLEKDPESRPSQAREIVAALADILGSVASEQGEVAVSAASDQPVEPDVRTITMLPFAYQGSDAEGQFLRLAVPMGIANEVSVADQVNVSPFDEGRSSRHNEDVRGESYVVTGSVLRYSNDVLIHCELVNVAENRVCGSKQLCLSLKSIPELSVEAARTLSQMVQSVVCDTSIGA